jgi:hypothetical protein
VSYRCDGPECLRRYDMQVAPAPHGHLRVTHTLVMQARRPLQAPWRYRPQPTGTAAGAGGVGLPMQRCSQCLSVHTAGPDGRWLPADHPWLLGGTLGAADAGASDSAALRAPLRVHRVPEHDAPGPPREVVDSVCPRCRAAWLQTQGGA